MTEAEWLACRDVGPLIAYLDTLPDTRRQLDWFDVACCRRVWDLLEDEQCQRAVTLIEQMPSEELSDDEHEELRDSTRAVVTAMERATDARSAARWFAARAVHAAVEGFDWRVASNVQEAITAVEGRIAGEQVAREQEKVLRCVLGNPFNPSALSPLWRTDTAVTLAKQMYEARDFGAMPILADALQDAGCEDADILGHCRGPGPHVRGCWVVDLVLGKD